MKRREFITLIGGATAAWPLAGHAEQGQRVRRIGVIMGFADDDEVWQTYLGTFRQRLQDFGWSEGRNTGSITGSPAKVRSACASRPRK